jgi:membrane protease YdiL (CAAX protease family)
MKMLKAFVKRHPVLSYFIFAFLLSWGGVLIAVAPAGFFGGVEHALFPFALVMNEAGPLLTGVLMTGLIYGKAGLREFAGRFLRWRVGMRWYVVALLATPLLVTPTLFVLSFVSPVFLPGIVASDDKTGLLLAGLMAGLLGGLFEEPGWTGFAIPELRRRYGVLTTGLIVGFLWAAWHFLLTFWASGDASGAFSPALLLPPMLFYVGVLPPYRVLMVWVYDHTESLLVAVLMHGVLTGCTTFILAPMTGGASLASYYVVLTVLMWVVVGAVAAANGGHLSRPPLRMRPA